MNQKIKVKYLCYSVVKKCYKYMLGMDYKDHIAINTIKGIKTDHYRISPKGILLIKKDYSWDGATGVPDTTSVFRASLVHDCLYQMMRENGLSSQYRKKADQIFYDICRADGLNIIVAGLYYIGIRTFGWLFVKNVGYKALRNVRKFRWMLIL